LESRSPLPEEAVEGRQKNRNRGRLVVRYGVERPERTAFTMNLSLTGAFLKTNNVMRPGTLIQIEVEMGSEKITLWANVVWAKRVPSELAHLLECGMGVRFVNPGPEWERMFNDWQTGKAPGR
jgi:hypothetical protein